MSWSLLTVSEDISFFLVARCTSGARSGALCSAYLCHCPHWPLPFSVLTFLMDIASNPNIWVLWVTNALITMTRSACLGLGYHWLATDLDIDPNSHSCSKKLTLHCSVLRCWTMFKLKLTAESSSCFPLHPYCSNANCNYTITYICRNEFNSIQKCYNLVICVHLSTIKRHIKVY